MALPSKGVMMPLRLGKYSQYDLEQETWEHRVSQKAISEKAKDEEEALKKIYAKYDVNKSLTILKLAGIGVSLVDFNPRELCYFSMEGIVYLNELNIFKDDMRTKTFTKHEASIRNCQLDDCLSAAIPIVFGPKHPFRRIEREFRRIDNLSDDHDKKKAEKMKVDSHFLRAWICFSEETDGTINTKTIEDIEVEMIETDLNLQVKFLTKIQDMLGMLGKLSSQFGILGTSTVMLDQGVLSLLMLR